MIKKLTYPIALFLCLATAFADSFSVSGHLVRKYRTTTMGGGVTTLGYTDGHFQRFVGTIGQTVLLPPANTLIPGVTYNVINESSAGNVVLKYADASTIASTLPPNSAGNVWFTNVTLFSTSGTGTNGTWSVQGPIVGGAGFGFPNVDVPAGTDPTALTAYDTLTISSTLGTMRLNGYATNSINFEVGTIGDNQIIGTAGIARSKVAAGTANRVVVNDGSGFLTDNAALSSSGIVFVDGSGNLKTSISTLGGIYWDDTSKRLSLGTDLSANYVQLSGASLGSVLTVDDEASSDLAQSAIHRHTATAAYGAHQVFTRSRGTNAAPTAVTAGDTLGRIVGAGHDGTDYEQAANIVLGVDALPGNNDMPGNIIFNVSSDGTVTPTQAMKIAADHSVVINGNLTVGGGIYGPHFISNGDVIGTAGIVYQKLDLAGQIRNTDIIGTAGIPYSKLSLAGAIQNSDIIGTAGIAYSKLSLAGNIVNADIKGTAGIARNKIATGTNNAIVINTTNGYLGTLAGSTSGQVATWNGSVWTASPPAAAPATVVYYAFAGNSAGTAGCTSDPCVIMRQSGGVSSVSRIGAGAYNVNFSSGTFGGTPYCGCTGDPNHSGNQDAYNYQTSNATTGQFYLLTAAGAGSDGTGYCSCWY